MRKQRLPENLADFHGGRRRRKRRPHGIVVAASVWLALAGWLMVAPRDGLGQATTESADSAVANPSGGSIVSRATEPRKQTTKTVSDSASGKRTIDAQGSSNSPFGAFENSRNRGPINIQSDTLALDYKGNTVLFSGKVHAVQADGQLTSNTLNVKYGKDFRVVQEMIADGTVRVSQGVQWCTADHMVLNQTVHTAVLTGSPVCHDANDQISGPKITVHTDTGRSEVEGGVKALIFPHDSKTRDNEASSSRAN